MKEIKKILERRIIFKDGLVYLNVNKKIEKLFYSFLSEGRIVFDFQYKDDEGFFYERFKSCFLSNNNLFGKEDKNKSDIVFLNFNKKYFENNNEFEYYSGLIKQSGVNFLININGEEIGGEKKIKIQDEEKALKEIKQKIVDYIKQFFEKFNIKNIEMPIYIVGKEGVSFKEYIFNYLFNILLEDFNLFKNEIYKFELIGDDLFKYLTEIVKYNFKGDEYNNPLENGIFEWFRGNKKKFKEYMLYIVNNEGYSGMYIKEYILKNIKTIELLKIMLNFYGKKDVEFLLNKYNELRTDDMLEFSSQGVFYYYLKRLDSTELKEIKKIEKEIKDFNLYEGDGIFFV